MAGKHGLLQRIRMVSGAAAATGLLLAAGLSAADPVLPVGPAFGAPVQAIEAVPTAPIRHSVARPVPPQANQPMSQGTPAPLPEPVSSPAPCACGQGGAPTTAPLQPVPDGAVIGCSCVACQEAACPSCGAAYSTGEFAAWRPAPVFYGLSGGCGPCAAGFRAAWSEHHYSYGWSIRR